MTPPHRDDPCVAPMLHLPVPGPERVRVVQVMATGTNGGAQEHVINLVRRLDRDFYDVSIVSLSPGSAVLLCLVSALAAAGASGVPSGSLLLVPLSCSLFGISYDVAMQVVAVGFIISVVQDSFETALNSSTDVIYTYAVDRLGRPDPR